MLRIIFALLAAVLLLLQFTAPHHWLAVGTVLLWRAVAFGNVPGLQVYVVKQAERLTPQAVAVASACRCMWSSRPSASRRRRWTWHRA